MILFLFLSSLGVYLNSLPDGFVYDDQLQILKNPWITSFGYIPDIFTRNVWSFWTARVTSSRSPRG
jgi:hypothetical protein